MQWVSNGDPPLYVWEGDTWYNQKNKFTYEVCIEKRYWQRPILQLVMGDNPEFKIDFPKKTKIQKAPS